MSRERLAVACLALCGVAISSYLALFQLGWIGAVWDPLFGSASSEAVLRSTFSRSLPVPDSAVGALAYAVEVVLALSGRFTVALGALLVAMALAGVGLAL